MNTTPEQFISQAQRVALTPQEKAAMRHMLQAHMQTASEIPGATPWFSRHIFASSFAAALLIIGGLGVSATKAQPGDCLSDFRTEINDRVQVGLTFDEDQKFDVETQQIERQLAGEDAAADKELREDEDNTLNEDNGRPESFNNGDNKGRGNDDETAVISNKEDDDLDKDARKLEKEISDAEKDGAEDLDF